MSNSRNTDLCFYPLIPVQLDPTDLSIADIQICYLFCKTESPTTAALAMLNDQVKKGGVMASSYVGGLSGAFIPSAKIRE